jgi:hypothetical protein
MNIYPVRIFGDDEGGKSGDEEIKSKPNGIK